MSKWLKKKKLYVLGAIFIIATLAWFLTIFPDPYHEGEDVNVYVWLWREIDELAHGEV